jgi:hypothetical protein
MLNPSRVFSATVAIMALVPLADESLAATKKKKKGYYENLTSEQKTEYRRKALEACKKAYATDGSGIVGIKIKTDGSIICYLRE